MFAKKSISRLISVFLIVMVLLPGVLPVYAESFARPLFANGDFAWAKSIGGVSGDFGHSVAVDSSGNVYTTGYFEGTVDFDPGAGTANLTSIGIGVDLGDIFVSKLDSNGNFVWARSMGGASNEVGFGIAVDSNFNVYTTGHFIGTADFDPGAGTANLTSVGGGEIFVSKLDSNGNFVWARSMGGPSYEVGSGIAVDPSGNVYTMGYFQVPADFDPGAGTFNLTPAGGTDIFVSKLDGGGNFVWAKGMGGTGNDFGNDIALDSSGNVYTTGEFFDTADFDPGAGTANLTSAGDSDIFVSKLNSDGSFAWAKSIGGIDLDSSAGIILDSSGNVYTTGNFFGTVDFDPGAGTSNLTGAGPADIFISKLDSSGNFVWAKSMGGTSDEYGSSVAVDLSGNVYTAGFFFDTVDFDPSAGTFNLTSAGSFDIFVSKLDNSGNFVWAKSMGGTENDHGNDIAVDSSGNVYTTGYFNGTADFDSGAGTTNLTSAGGADIFISKLINAVTSTSIFESTNTQDGWILEKSETNGAGGTKNSTATTLRVGDDAANRQYRAILSFDTSTLPEGAVITSVTLKFKYAGKTGTLPFGTHGNLLVDICDGAFKGNPALQLGDFKPTCSKNKALSYTNAKVDNWYSQSLNPVDEFQFINLDGVTQFRLRFTKDDNNDSGADFLKIFSGNAAEADRPQLIIEYTP